MNNLRFATSLHILSLLALQDGELLSSEYIAGSININPAVVRKEISNLRDHGLIESKEGKGGGSTLAKPAGKIWLSDIYNAVRQAPILGRSNEPNPECIIGRQINKHLQVLYADAEDALVARLRKTQLSEFIKQFV